MPPDPDQPPNPDLDRIAEIQELGFSPIGYPNPRRDREDERVMQRLRWGGFENWEQG